VPPEKERVHDVQAQDNGSYAWAMEMADKMERLIRYEPDKAEQFWHQIHKKRMRDQAAGKGDFSESNIVYKFLSKRGLFPKLEELTGEHIAKEIMPTASVHEAWGPTEQFKGLMTGDRPKATSPLLRPKWQRQRIDAADRAYENAWGNYAKSWEGEHGLWQTPGSYYPREANPDNLYQLWQRKYEEREGDHGSLSGDWQAARPKAQQAWPAELAQRHQGLLQGHQDTASKMYQHGLIDEPAFEHATEWGMQKAQQLGHDPTTFAPDPVFQAEQAPAQLDPTPEQLGLPRPMTSDTGIQAALDANAGQNLQGLPGPVNVPGYGPLQFHSNADIQRVANEYNQAAGLGPHPTDYLPINPAVSEQIAAEYERMPHNPEDPTTAAAYQALANESMAQYQAARRNGYQFEFYPEQDPYPNSPREAVMDLHRNKHMYVYPTEAGYGSGEDLSGQPLLQHSGETWNGRPVTYNDIFRAIHDFYGHAKEGLGFRGHGEDNAYRQHAAMFSPLARRALASETRGQNSWVNYGPYGQQNQVANSAETVYAPQKAGLLPEWATDPDLHRQAPTTAAAQYEGIVRDGGRHHHTHDRDEPVTL
jgi:hypothetical protein